MTTIKVIVTLAHLAVFSRPRDALVLAFLPSRSSLLHSVSGERCCSGSGSSPLAAVRLTETLEHHVSRTRRRRTALPPCRSSPSETILDADPPDRRVGDELRERARALRREAAAEEQELRCAARQRKESEREEADQWISMLLGSAAARELDGSEAPSPPLTVIDAAVPTAQTLAIRIEENKLGPQKLQKIVERLHERETAMMTGPEGYLSKEETSLDGGNGGGGGFVLGDYENNSLEYKQEETLALSGLLDQVLEATQILDDRDNSNNNNNNNNNNYSNNNDSRLAPKLRQRVSDLRQSRDALLKRRVDNIVGTATDSQNNSLGDYIQKSIDGNGEGSNRARERSKAEKAMKRMIERPPWLPLSLATFAANSPVEVPVASWKSIKTDVLAGSDFFCTSWDNTDVAAIFRGRLPRARTAREAAGASEPRPPLTFAAVFEDLQARVANHPTLREQVCLFLVYDYEWRPATTEEMREGPPPAILALAAEVGPEQESERGWSAKSLAALSNFLTVVTMFGYSLSVFALNPTFFRAVVTKHDVTAVPVCLPIFAGVLALAALHEAGHLVAAWKHRVRLGWPTLLPSLQVGTFGAITPLRSFPPTRTALFDVALSGPAASLLASGLLIVAGLSLTLSAPSLAAFPVVPAAVLRSSALVGAVASVVAPRMMMAPLSQPLAVHPLFFVGFAGLVMSSVNLLPIGRLDGGRGCMAAWGRRVASLVSLLSLILLAFYIFSGVSGTVAFWGAIVVTTQRMLEIPTINEVTGVGEMRVNCYIALLALAGLALCPFPDGVGPI